VTIEEHQFKSTCSAIWVAKNQGGLEKNSLRLCWKKQVMCICNFCWQETDIYPKVPICRMCGLKMAEPGWAALKFHSKE